MTYIYVLCDIYKYKNGQCKKSSGLSRISSEKSSAGDAEVTRVAWWGVSRSWGKVIWIVN